VAAGVASWPAESIVRYDLCKSALSGLVTREPREKVVAWAEARAVAARFPYWIKSADKPTTYGIIRAMAEPPLPGKILAEKATAKVGHRGDHRGNRGRGMFGLSTQNAPAAWRRSETGANSLLHFKMSTEKQFEQAAFNPKFQMPAILGARPKTNLCHRGCWSSAILLKHVEQSLIL
jgi:hypothetical protein